jgi:BirA family transcriptional regulator, biotin operon repressor / biotin---[acetyl-CoA-carboxylase] ligase
VTAGLPSLEAASLARALIRPGGLWREIRVVAETGSTNTDLLGEAVAGAAEGAVLAAEAQTAGRGRLGRRWLSPPGVALTFSVLLRPPGVPARRRSWVPLLAGVAAVAAVRRVAAVGAVLKWPNDVLVGEKKLAGILAEQAGDAIVAGIGINFAAVPPGPAGAAATAVEVESTARVSRDQLLVAVLCELEDWYRRWTADPDGCGLRQQYTGMCATIGRSVRVGLPGGRVLTGAAADVDEDGRLVVRGAGRVTAVSAGDVVHVR